MNPDTQKIIALVEKQTGYRVNVYLSLYPALLNH